MTIWEARNLGIKQLQHSQQESNGRISFLTPTLDCDCLLSHVLDKDRSFLLSHNQDFLDIDDEKEFFSLLEKRSSGMPIAYIIGKKEFYGFDFIVTDDVLIPKADTELLVEKSIEIIQRHVKKSNQQFKFADICTGSACISLSILKTIFSYTEQDAHKKITCHATDIAGSALNIAKKNAHVLLSVEEQKSISFFEGDLLEPLANDDGYDLIVSNPPYVPSSIVDELLQDGRGEPRLALDGDVDDNNSANGLSIIQRLIPQVWQKVKSGGEFLIETGEYNAAATLELMSKCGFVDCTTYKDLSGQPRVSYGRKP